MKNIEISTGVKHIFNFLLWWMGRLSVKRRSSSSFSFIYVLYGGNTGWMVLGLNVLKHQSS